MNNFWKVVLTALLACVLIGTGIGFYKLYTGNWFSHASFITIGVSIIAAVVLVYLIIKGFRGIWTALAFGMIVMTSASCNYAKSNQKVVVSTDCGMTWEEIKAGEAIPKEGLNRCYMKVVMPNYPMQGDARFIGNLSGRVRAVVHIDYDYEITNALAFIKQAKFLGRANSDADDDAATGTDSRFETAENMVIDKRIKEVSKSILLGEDIVELDQADLEQRLHDAANKMLEPLGISLNFITLTFDLDEQTRQAIDVSTAMKIYNSKDLVEVGKTVIAARAGATKVTVENKTEAKKED